MASVRITGSPERYFSSSDTTSHTSGGLPADGRNSSNAAAASGFAAAPSGPSTHANGTGSEVCPRLTIGVR